jgi:hypothetical protein
MADKIPMPGKFTKSGQLRRSWENAIRMPESLSAAIPSSLDNVPESARRLSPNSDHQLFRSRTFS